MVLAAQVRGDPLRLRLGERHDRADRLQQPDEREARVARREDAAVEVDPVVRRGEQALVEEREADLVARAVDDDVGVHPLAVGELHPVRAELRDVRPRRDRAVDDAVEDPARHRRVRLPEAVVGLGQAVALGPADVQADDELRDAGVQPVRHVRQRADLIQRLAEQVLRHDPRAAAGGEVRAASDVAGLDGDVHRAVAHPEHDDVLAGEKPVVAVRVGVHLDALERRRCRGTRAPGQRWSQWWPLATTSMS